MTQEEKARAYDEALERAQKATRAASDAAMDIVQYIFPQLCESEDERIRQKLMWLLQQDICPFPEEEVTQMLNYLEKQKEQKHYWKPTETDVALFNKAVITNKTLTPTEMEQLDIIRSRFGCCRAVNCNGIVQEEQKPLELAIKEITKDEDSARTFLKNAGIIDENGELAEIYRCEQKPTEWDEKDDMIRGQIAAIIDMRPVTNRKELLTWLKKQKSTNIPERICPKFSVGDTVCRKGYADHTVIEIYLWKDPVYICKNDEGLESHISFSEQDKWEKKEQKPAEWSEEDEKFINELCGLLAAIAKDGYVGRYYAPDLVNHLKSLRPQPKQEWSDEDEKMRDFIIKDVMTLHNARNLDELKKKVDWLKSLRPQKKEDLAKMLQDEYEKGKEYGETLGQSKGFTHGYTEGFKAGKESVLVKHNDNQLVWCDGTHCINPHHDCVNCPAKYSSSGTITTPNSATIVDLPKEDEK